MNHLPLQMLLQALNSPESPVPDYCGTKMICPESNPISNTKIITTTTNSDIYYVPGTFPDKSIARNCVHGATQESVQQEVSEVEVQFTPCLGCHQGAPRGLAAALFTCIN